ncbi:MAG: hypothetical protein R6X02_09120 [Enhygromyxa sp.]
MRRYADRLLAWLGASWPALVVLAFAAWLLWPVPRGAMPMSADHPVHLTRIVLTAERLLGHGALSGWEPTWFFGFPLGELYPQLGDLLIIAIRGLSFGALDWPSAYALGFFLVFAIQGLVLIRIGRLFGFGPWPGLIAALLMLGDAGFTREGGWMYTVYFGVWPQALATSLAYLGLGELARGLGWAPTRRLEGEEQPRAPDQVQGMRATVLAGVCFGAALLAHPIALPSLAIGGGLALVTLVPRAPVPWRTGLVRCALAGLLGLLLAAWWLAPMLQHAAWMASYGWLYAPLEVMLRWLSEDGRWAQRMPAAVGFTALLGIALASLGAGRAARFVALFALVQWLLASDDTFWRLRLDRLSEGFTHIQYQRFLIGAKPGLFLCAGLAVVAPLGWARRLWLGRTRAEAGVARRWAGSLVPFGLAPLGAALALWLLADSRAAIAEFEVGEVQTERMPGDPEFDPHYRDFLQWARAQWDAREHDYRIAIETPRNSHLFMDAPIWTATPQYKIGFTPGDNFVHKPESGRRELLDALGVRFIVGVDRSARTRPGEVARFGPIRVREHRGQPRPLAWLEGEGTIEIVEADLRGGLVRARIRDAGPGDRITFAIAGYPRWKLFVDGEPLEWFEQPVWGSGPPASVSARAAGELRGGKARGDDGSEPTLIAAVLSAGLSAGLGDAELLLRYEQRGVIEGLVELASVLGWIAAGVLLFGRGRGRRVFAWIEARSSALAHPLVIGAAVLAVLGLGAARWQGAAEREGSQLLGWVEAGAARAQAVELGPVKTDMLIRPAVLLRPRPGRPAVVEIEVDELPKVLLGWAGLDDDQAQQRGTWARHELRIDARPRDATGADPQWSTIARVSVPHQPGRVQLAIDTGILAGRPVILRIVDETRGKRLPRLGVNLELGVRP